MAVRDDLKILDERIDGDRVAVTVERAEHALKTIGREGIEHRIVDLNLDEIFEAYVAGRRPDSPTSPRRAPELQPLV
jgi:ABC-2 type transport system ATP-binding protein